MTSQEITCSVDAGGHWTLDGTVRAECTGADADVGACLSLVVSMPQGAITVILDGDETRRLRAQIDDATRGPLRTGAAPTGDDAEIRSALDDCTPGKWTTCLGADLYVAVSDGTEEGSRSDVLATIAVEHATSPRQTADAWLMAYGKAHAVEVLRLRAHVEDLRDTVCNLLAEIGDPALICNAVPGCVMHATWECADDGYSTGACDTHREGRAGEWHPAPHADALRSLDGVSR